MFSFFRYLVSAWSWKMALRDSRASKRKLALFSVSIVFGVAALVTIGSLKQNLNESMRSQAKSLLGADIQVSARRVYSETAKATVHELGGEQLREISFTTMLTVGENPQPSLANIRGIESGFPFYGSVSTTPANAWQDIHVSNGVIVEESFLLKMNGKIGDFVRIGDRELTIVGTLDQAAPASTGFSGITPTVITSLSNIEDSPLLQGKSLSFHRTHIKLPNNENAEAIANQYKAAMQTERLRVTTAKERSENIQKAVNNLYVFLNLIGFSSLFLGGIGIAGAIHIHISERLRSVAILRCLGCSTARAFAIYFIQGASMGAFGTLFGVITGCGILVSASQLIEHLPGSIPVAIEIAPVLAEVIKAAIFGFMICLCFALLPLLRIRKVSPLFALRASLLDNQSSARSSGRDPLRWMIYGFLALTVFSVAWIDNHQLRHGLVIALSYVVFLALVFGILWLCGFVLKSLLRRLIHPRLPFTVRQGLSALYRPNNQTSIFILSIGLGVFFLFTLLLTQNVLIQWLSPDRLDGKPNLFMMDVPPEETGKANSILSESGVTPLGEAPIIQLQLAKIKGIAVKEIITSQVKNQTEDDAARIPSWILTRSFRSTYRSELSDTEVLTSGKWVSYYDDLESQIPISLEEGIAGDLGLNLGDTLTMEVEGFGESMEMVITSFRKVDWQSMNLNFFIVLPEGPIQDYVAFNIVTGNSPAPQATATLQKKMFKEWPFVNVIDLSLILKTAQSILTATAIAIEIMALFTVITGSIVLISSVLAGRRMRLKESTLLRTLGASQSQIAKLLSIEYLALAVLATLSGAGLAAVACLLISENIFDNEPYYFPWAILVIASTLVILITVLIGMLLSIGIAKTPPMRSIRENES